MFVDIFGDTSVSMLPRGEGNGEGIWRSCRLGSCSYLRLRQYSSEFGLAYILIACVCDARLAGCAKLGLEFEFRHSSYRACGYFP